jgi:hypothetical protein
MEDCRFGPSLRGWIEVEVRDGEGRLLQRGRHEMRSFTNNFLRVFYGLFNSGLFPATGVGLVSVSTTVVGTDGASKTIYTEWYAGAYVAGGGTVIACKAGGNDDTYGIVVGYGTTAMTLDNYTLAGKIGHGTSSNQLVYGDMDVTDVGLDTGVKPNIYRVRLSRTFTNGSPSTVTVCEVGLLARNYWRDTSATRNDVKFLIARDVLPTSYSIPVGGTATVYITVEVEMA